MTALVPLLAICWGDSQGPHQMCRKWCKSVQSPVSENPLDGGAGVKIGVLL